MSPSGGQGASLALEDALYLVKLLRQFSGEFEPVFAEFERGRHGRTAKITLRRPPRMIHSCLSEVTQTRNGIWNTEDAWEETTDHPTPEAWLFRRGMCAQAE